MISSMVIMMHETMNIYVILQPSITQADIDKLNANQVNLTMKMGEIPLIDAKYLN